MKKDEIVKLLQHRRHDLVNDLQVMHGYASMEMYDRVQEKLEEFTTSTEHERNLHMLQAPSFILWVEMLRMRHKNFYVTYEIHDTFNLGAHDEWLTHMCEKLVQTITDASGVEDFYDLNLQVYKNKQVYVQLMVEHVDKERYEKVYEAFKSTEEARYTLSYEAGKLTCDFQMNACIEG